MSHQESTMLNTQTLFDQNTTQCIPIDFDFILARPPVINPVTMRAYVADIVAKMNKYFQIHMDGPFIGRLRITRLRRCGHSPIISTITVERARQLFPMKIICEWKNKNVKKKFNMNVIDVFLRSPKIRKELYCTNQMHGRQPPVILWLEKQLTQHRECPSRSTIRFGGLNQRIEIYNSFKNELNAIEVFDWTPKRISQSIYSLIPESRPRKGARTRLKGVPSIYIPQFNVCAKHLEQYKKLRSI